MPKLSALREVGKVGAPSLKVNFSAFVLDLGDIAHLRPHITTQNLLYVYSNDKRPVLASEEITHSKSVHQLLLSNAVTFPPRYIDTSCLKNRKARAGDIFIWMTRSGSEIKIFGCWVLEGIYPKPQLGTTSRIFQSSEEEYFMAWNRVNVRKSTLRHPLDENFRLNVDTDGFIGWVPVQTFAANSLVKDAPPPPEFENLGKVYDPSLGPLYVFLIRHEDSKETNLCYVSPSNDTSPVANFTPANLHWLYDSSATTRLGDVFIKLSGSSPRITPDSLIGRVSWVLMEGQKWSKRQKLNGWSVSTRHPVHCDYLLEMPNSKSPYPKWVCEPDAVQDARDVPTQTLHGSLTGVHTKISPPTNVFPLVPFDGAGDHFEQNVLDDSGKHSGQKLSESSAVPPDAKRRKLSGPTANNKTTTDRRHSASKKSRQTVRGTDATRIDHPGASDGFRRKVEEGGDDNSDSSLRRVEKTLLPSQTDAHHEEKRRADDLQSSLRNAEEALLRCQAEARERDVRRQAEISGLEKHLRDKCQRLQLLTYDVDVITARQQEMEKSASIAAKEVDEERGARSSLQAQLVQIQDASQADHRRITFLEETCSEAEIKLRSANSEISKLRSDVEQGKQCKEGYRKAFAEALENCAVSLTGIIGEEKELAVRELKEQMENDLRRANDEVECVRSAAFFQEQEARREVAALQDDCASNKEKIYVLSGKVEKLEHDITTRDEKLATEIQAKAEFERELQDMRQSLSGLQERYKSTMDKFTEESAARFELQLQLESQRTQLTQEYLAHGQKEKESMKEELLAQHESLQCELLSKIRDLENRNVELTKTLTDQRADEERSLAELSASKEYLATEIVKHEKVQGELCAQRDLLQCELRSKIQDLEVVQIELAKTVKDRSMDQECFSAELSASKDSLETALLEHEKMKGELHFQLKSSQHELQFKTRELETARIELAKIGVARGTDQERFRAELSSFEDSLKSEVAQRKQAEHERERAETQLNSMTQDLEGARTRETAETKQMASLLKDVALGLKGLIIKTIPDTSNCPATQNSRSASHEGMHVENQPSHHLSSPDFTPDNAGTLTRECTQLIVELSSWRDRSIRELSSAKELIEQERSNSSKTLVTLQQELAETRSKYNLEITAERLQKESLETTLDAIRSECRTPFVIPILLDLFIEMHKCIVRDQDNEVRLKEV